MESFIPAGMENESSYFEKAQDFRNIIKILRIKYLGLRALRKKDEEGNVNTVFIKDPKRFTGINEEGVEANIRFLETRLGKHVVLSSWDEERMYKILLDDMETWFWMMVDNMERYELSPATMREMRVLINDQLEYAYRRPIDDKERATMRPIGKEIRRVLGLDRDDEQQMQGYPQQVEGKMRKEMGY